MDGFYNCKSIINKEGFLLLRICLPFCYCFIRAMPEALHFLSIILYRCIINESAAHIFIFWCNKLSALFQHIFDKICNLSNFLINKHTVERCLSSRNFNEFLIYGVVYFNVICLLLKC